MTHLGPLRSQLLDQYIAKVKGEVIDPNGPNSPAAPALAQDYMQFLLGHPIEPILGDAHMWASKNAGRILANIPGEHRTTPPTDTEPFAEYTPSPLINKRAHRGLLWPWKGDLIVFDRNPHQGNPWGTLGAYLSHENEPPHWTVFTQGFGPPSLITIDATYLRPLGWWRVTDNRLLARTRQKVTA